MGQAIRIGFLDSSFTLIGRMVVYQWRPIRETHHHYLPIAQMPCQVQFSEIRTNIRSPNNTGGDFCDQI
jgi:hypothetical protein